MAEEKFYTILTNIGKAKIANATLLNSNVTLTTLKVGDGNGAYYNPTEEQKDLKNTVYTCQVGSISIDENNPNWVVVETIIPGSVGGFTIREIGLFDVDGDMIAVGKYPETYKPVVANGASKDLNVRTIFEVSNTENVTLSINPSVIIATKEDISNLQKQITSNDKDIAVLSNPNLLINDEFLVNQRDDGTGYYVINNVANGQYTFDRWKLGLGTIVSSYKLEKANIGIKISQLTEDSSFCDISQTCERIFKEDTILTASFKFEELDKTSKLAFITEEGTVLNELEFNSTGIYKFTFIQKANKKVMFHLRLHTLGAGELGYLRWCKLELGDKATPFYPRSYGEELALCKRYYEASALDVIIPGMKGSLGKYEAEYRFDVEKRIVPTLIYGNGGNSESNKFALFTLNIGGNLQEVIGSTIETKKVRFMINSTDSNVNGTPCTMTGYIKADAEIY